MRTVWLKTRCRIGIQHFAVVYSKSVATADLSIDSAGKVSTWFRCQRVKRSWRVRTALYNDIKCSRLWSPNAKMGLVFTDHFCADRVAALYLVNLLFSARHGSPTCERSVAKQPGNDGLLLARRSLGEGGSRRFLGAAFSELITPRQSFQNAAHEWKRAENRNL